MPTFAADSVLKDAFQCFEAALKPADRKVYKSTSLEDVYDAARIIERDQEDRQCMRNLRKIEPLLEALRKVGVAIDVLCQGTPYLSFIWVNILSSPVYLPCLHGQAPIKFLLHVSRNSMLTRVPGLGCNTIYVSAW